MSITETDDFPWPQPGLSAFVPGKSSNVTAHMDWFGMGTEESCASGFKDAIEAILSHLEQGEHSRHPDHFFYPVAFLSRHYLELRLKILIVLGSEFYPPPIQRNSLIHAHGLAELWSMLRPILRKAWPKGSQADLDSVEGVIMEFDKLDPRGISFRYAEIPSTVPDRVDLSNLWKAVSDVGSLLEGCTMAFDEWKEAQLSNRDA